MKSLIINALVNSNRLLSYLITTKVNVPVAYLNNLNQLQKPDDPLPDLSCHTLLQGHQG